jgi:uncharacterized protein
VLLGSRPPFDSTSGRADASSAAARRPAADSDPGAALALLDWRRRVAGLYAQVRRLDDPAEAHAHWAEGRDDLVRHHPASPVPAEQRAGFGGVPVAPYDAAYRFEVPVERALPLPWHVETGTDGTVPYQRVGSVDLDGLGSLDVWWLASYGGGLFVPLKDATSGQSTYGGGRYVLDTVKGADLGGEGDLVVVDLNFAYAPSCAYDAAWACPLPPEGNTLTAPVPVGELVPR